MLSSASSVGLQGELRDVALRGNVTAGAGHVLVGEEGGGAGGEVIGGIRQRLRERPRTESREGGVAGGRG